MTSADIAVVSLNAAEARNLTDEIRNALSIGYDGLVRAWQGRADQALGYDSWDDYCSTEFTEGRMVRLDREQRREIVSTMRDAGMSTRAIGSALGVDHKTVVNDLPSPGELSPPVAIVGTDGKTYTPKAHVTNTSRTSEATKTEYDVNTATGEIAEPNPIATAVKAARTSPAHIAGLELERVSVAVRGIRNLGVSTVVADIGDTDTERAYAADLLETLNRVIPTLTDLQTRLSRRNLRSVK